MDEAHSARRELEKIMTIECAEQIGFDNEWTGAQTPVDFAEWPQEMRAAYERGVELFRAWE